MPYVIRHKETGEIVKMRSGKSVWEKSSHAKASFKTSGLSYGDRARFGWSGPRGTFDTQDMFEIVEAKIELSEEMKRALHLLKEATFEIPASGSGATMIHQINQFLKGVKQ